MKRIDRLALLISAVLVLLYGGISLVQAGTPREAPPISDNALANFLDDLAAHLNTLECLTADPNGSVLGTHGELKCANFGGNHYICMNTGTGPSKTTAWTCFNIAGSGSTITVEDDDVVVDSATATIDFRDNITVTSSPSGEANVNAVPSGSNQQIQFNNSGSFGAESAFTYIAASDRLSIGGDTSTSTIYFSDSTLSNSGRIQYATSLGDGQLILQAVAAAGASFPSITINAEPTRSAISLTPNAGGATIPVLTMNPNTSADGQFDIMEFNRSSGGKIQFAHDNDTGGTATTTVVFQSDSTNRTITFPLATGTVALFDVANVWTGTQDFSGATTTLGASTSADAITVSTINTGNGAVELAAGQWTPTTNNIANLDSSSAAEGQYIRVGATVTGSIQLTVNPTTANTSTQLELDLPITSNFGATSDAAGSCGSSDIEDEVASIRADTASDELEVLWVTNSAASHELTCAWSYQII